ncbi:MAG: Xaa-Pro peptidase family protein [Euryarchaeota archaeon]|nr:Xaa-Pro peptidase family protein [Euryarchaeota archaeon]
MDPDFSRLDAHLDSLGVDAYAIDAASTDSNQRYLSGFDAPDPFFTCYTPEELSVLVSGLEYGRARTESRADRIERPVAYDKRELVDAYGPREASHRVAAAFLSAGGVESVAVPERFPVGTADGLREQGIEVVVDTDDVLVDIRAVKTPPELDHVRAAQRANEAAMAAAEGLIERSTIGADGQLLVDGETLTSERVKEAIEITLLKHGCGLDETIVTCGERAADPHDRGSGPLYATEPIIVDIFPRNKSTKYHADMTRTFCKGEPDETLAEWYDLTERALAAALDAVEPGNTGEDVHAAACAVYEDAGLPTLRADPSTETGFIHSTGHGVGLDVHERPRLSTDGGDLVAGQVITVEPGLYDPAVGGVRIEDIVIVTDDGYENITEYPIELVVD